MKKAIIYLRVSTTKQVEGASLETQQMLCQEWASRNKILVDKIYHDDGVSAKTLDRPEMKKMLAYIKANRGNVNYLITYQTDRLTRNATDFFTLQAMLSKLGIEYKNINSSLEENANTQLIQSLEAVMAQYDNSLKSERVKANMKLKAQKGYRMSHAPHGLKNTRDILGGSTLIPIEGVADKIATVLEAYATGAYTIASLLRLCEEIGLRSAHDKPIQFQALSKILRMPIYAGLEQNVHTGGQLVPSVFEGIISPATFYRNQDILRNNKNTAAKYKKNNPIFPLRRFVLCAKCHKPLTGSSPSNGSGEPSSRYHCARCKVPSVKVEELHEQFLDLLSSISPNDHVERFLKEVIVRVWQDEIQTLHGKEKKLHREAEQLADRKNQIVEKLVSGEITFEEKQGLVSKVNESLELVQNQLREITSVTDLKDQSIDFALLFMSNAPRIWSTASIEHKIIYQRLVLPKGIEYDLSKNEFGTPELSTLYRLANIKKDPSRSDESLVVILRFQRLDDITIRYASCSIIGYILSNQRL